MPVNITIPSPGESVSEVVLGPWTHSDGDWVDKDEPLVEIESDKVTLEVPAPESGVLSIKANEGDELNVGDTIGVVDPNAEKPAGAAAKTEAAPAESNEEFKLQQQAASSNGASSAVAAENADARATSVAKKIAADRGVDLAAIAGTGPSGRVTKSDVLAVADNRALAPQSGGASMITTHGRGARREKMSKLRQRIAERLVQAQQNAAMLTTFNEADMTEVMALRKQHKDSVQGASTAWGWAS